MSTLWIYGDSHVDINYPTTEVNTWPKLLQQSHTVVNRSRCGTGPDWSIKRLLEDRLQHQPTDTCLFVLSWPHRLDLENFYRNSIQQAELLWIPNKPEYSNSKKQFAKNLIEHLITDSWCNLETLKHLALLDNLAEEFAGTLIVPVMPVPQINLKTAVLAKPIHANTIPLQSDPLPNHLTPQQHLSWYKCTLDWLNQINTI